MNVVAGDHTGKYTWSWMAWTLIEGTRKEQVVCKSIHEYSRKTHPIAPALMGLGDLPVNTPFWITARAKRDAAVMLQVGCPKSITKATNML